MSVTLITRQNARVVSFTDDPTASDAGFQLGTLWLNTTDNRAFVCLANGAGVAVWSPLGGSFISFTASTDLTAPACVALNSSGTLIYGNASAKSTSNVIGFIPTDIASSGVGLVQYAGRFTFTGATFSSLGDVGYLGLSDGQISETPPAFASGRVIKPVCIILSAADILISLQSGRVY